MTIFGQARHPFTHAVHGEKLSRKTPFMERSHPIRHNLTGNIVVPV